MDRAYNICILIGIGVPLLSLLLGSLLDFIDGIFDGLSNLFDGLDIDFDLDIEIGSATISLLPLSMHGICTGLLLFGIVGKILSSGSSPLTANVVGACSGYLGAVAIQTLINKLKKVDHSPIAQEDLKYCEAKVTNTIVAGGFGAVSICAPGGTPVSYPAKASDGTTAIKQDTTVNIIRFEKNVAIVKKANHSINGEELTLFHS